jgi:phage terminase small subunit
LSIDDVDVKYGNYWACMGRSRAVECGRKSSGESVVPKVGEQIEKGGKRITPPQQKFLDNYIHKDMTQTAAARAAGYKNPNVSAVQLLNNPRVKERMEEMRQELESKYGVTITKSVRDMQRLRDEAWEAGNFGAAIKAEELRLKVTGLMVARSHVTHETVDNLSRDQIVEQLQEFMQRAKDRMIDVTPEQNPTKPEHIPITDYSGEADK